MARSSHRGTGCDLLQAPVAAGRRGHAVKRALIANGPGLRGVEVQTEKDLGSLVDLAAFVVEAELIRRVVTVVPTVSELDGTPVSPELVLVDPTLRVHLATRESASPEVVELPQAVIPIDVPAGRGAPSGEPLSGLPIKRSHVRQAGHNP